MKKYSVIFFLFVLLLLVTLTVQAAELGFRNKNSKALQLDCSKSNNNKQFAYTCYDHDGNETYINEGAEWELIHFEKVCFRHKQRDSIRVCLEFIASGSKGKSYGCANGKGQYLPPDKNWGLMTGSSAICTEQLQHYEVPRTMEFSIGME